MNVIARVIAAIVLGPVLALALGVWSAAGAAAHTTLASSDPADGASLPTAPASVTLTFSEDINPAFANIAVSAADGRNRVSGPAAVDGTRLRAPVGPDLPGGAYTVAYRVVSADGHPVSGSVRFTVAGAPGAPTVEAAPPSSAPEEASGPLGSDSTTSILVAGAAGLIVAGAVVFWQSRKRRRTEGAGDDGSAD